MATHMKTTIDISDTLLVEAKRVAARDGTTVKALVEQGLRQALAERRRGGGRFKLRRASVSGNGLQPDARGADWEQLRALAYEGRGA